MTALITVLAVIVVVSVAAAFLVGRRNREANVARAEQLRAQAATQGESTIAPAQERAAVAEAEAEQARAAAAEAEAAAEEARLAAQQVEATQEGQVRAADRIDPRVDHEADDYAPRVPDTTDAPAEEGAQQGRAPLLPRRTPGAQEMPGQPLETSDDGGGWFTKDPGKNPRKNPGKNPGEA